MKLSQPQNPATRVGNLFRRAASLLVLLGWLCGSSLAAGGDAPALTEYQVKALFLLNFAKYADWPAEVFPQEDTPITIGVVGANDFGPDLAQAVEGKTVAGRRIVLLPAEKESDWGKCRILFISASEKKRLPEILAALKTLPVLTVGETEQFTAQGGMINFIKKDGRVRLEISLDAARQAHLQISSKLLSVADAVHGNKGAGP